MEALPEGGLRVLIVEDSQLVAELTGELVASFGHDVRVVHDGPAALRMNQEFHPRVVLLDISLPGMSGYEVAKQLRQAASGDQLLVAVTGYDEEEDRRRALANGFDRHLVKPIQPEMLEEIFTLASRGREH